MNVGLEWGVVGAPVIAAGCDVAVVDDVLSFTTTLSVAPDRGVAVWPCPWADDGVADRARTLAAEHRATLAVARAAAGPGAVSLSPATVRAADGLTRLVLPSPNGSTVSALLARQGVGVVGACLRNARAVARRVRDAGRVAVVPAGERWPDGSLRPAVEDLWGAGAVIHALGDVELTPEARVASAAFVAVADDLHSALHECVSGRELDGLGFPSDVDIAAEVDSSDTVPVLRDGVFVPG